MDETGDFRSPAQIGYDAYSLAAAGHSLVSGDPLPEWKNLPGDVQSAWGAAVDAIMAAHQCL